MKKVSFVAVNYNNTKITLQYIKSIYSLIDIDKYLEKVIIVDNASEKKEYEQLVFYGNKFLNMEIIRSEENLGYAKGINLGLSYLRQKSLCEDYIIAGNNDMTFEKHFLINLTKKMYDVETYIIVPDVITLQGVHQNPQRQTNRILLKDYIQFIRYSNYFLGICVDKLIYYFNKNNKKRYKKPKSGYIYIPIGVCFILTQNYLRKCIQLEPITFLWSEEGILAAQVEKAGGKIYYDNRLEVTHLESASVKKMLSKQKYKYARESFWIWKKYLKEQANKKPGREL